MLMTTGWPVKEARSTGLPVIGLVPRSSTGALEESRAKAVLPLFPRAIRTPPTIAAIATATAPAIQRFLLDPAERPRFLGLGRGEDRSARSACLARFACRWLTCLLSSSTGVAADTCDGLLCFYELVVRSYNNVVQSEVTGGRMRTRRRVVAGRRIGAIEAELLERLWEAERPLTVREIAATLSGKPRAYTTVVTMLTRLMEKGLVRRLPAGRSFVYEASGSQEEIAAGTLREVLRGSGDPRAVLARFVEELAQDPKLMRQLTEIVERRARR